MRPSIVASSALLSLLIAAAAVADSTLPATGQKTCWNTSGAKVSCNNKRQDGADRAGRRLYLLDGGNGTLADRNTRLVWEKLSRDGGIHDRDTLYTWDQAGSVKIAQLNTPPCFAGLCSWRLPNAKELQSIVDYEQKSPAMAKQFMKKCRGGCTIDECSCTPDPAASVVTGFWSSTTNASATGEAWQTLHATGQSVSRVKTSTANVRAVAEATCSSAIVTVTTAYAASDSPVSGVITTVAYPGDLGSIPGSGGDASVIARVTNQIGVAGGLFSAGDNDTDGDNVEDQIRVGLVFLTAPGIAAGPFAEIRFDCSGSEAPLLTDLACTLDASDGDGLPVPGTCALSVRYE